MKDIQKRFFLFLFGCIAFRALIMYTAKTIDVEYLPFMGYISIIPAIGFLYLFFTGSRKTGFEVFGAKIWWNYLRPIHAILYLLFAYYAIHQNSNAWKFLAYDIIFGLLAFLSFHTYNGDFSIIF
jgi:hypothetical protein